MKDRKLKHSGREDGFTLIELLVVITIIVMLLSVIIPSLKNAKRYATIASCLNNQKSLCMSWLMYSQDNDDRICGGVITSECMYDGLAGGNLLRPPLWVWPPVTEELNYVGELDAEVTLEDRQRGCMKGALSVYFDSVKTVHCPSDSEYRRVWPYRYRGYSIPAGLAVYSVEDDIVRVGEIKSAANKYCFVEEDYDGNMANYNHAAWDFDPESNSFWDPLALFHNDSSTFAFADGHADRYKWRDARTVQFFTDRDSIGWYMPENIDLKWLQRGFAYKAYKE
jgi:prepilin-type N-terminal cleavage/methylation domain-containing protein/prepilin-type processing-associated H-X9-DG protein